MKQILYHGTSADNLASILKNGLTISSGGQLWNCAEGALFFWSPSELVEAGEAEEDQAIDRAKSEAISSAQFSLAIAKDCRIVVVTAEIDLRDIEADDSCPNMAGSGAVCVRRDIGPKEIKSIEVSGDLSLLRAYFLAMALDREYSAVQMSDMEEKIARAMQKAEIYPEDVDEMIVMQPVEISTRRKRTA